ncbi:hypothetical protein D3C78_1465560 [compost metagenome]
MSAYQSCGCSRGSRTPGICLAVNSTPIRGMSSKPVSAVPQRLEAISNSFSASSVEVSPAKAT